MLFTDFRLLERSLVTSVFNFSWLVYKVTFFPPKNSGILSSAIISLNYDSNSSLSFPITFTQSVKLVGSSGLSIRYKADPKKLISKAIIL